MTVRALCGGGGGASPASPSSFAAPPFAFAFAFAFFFSLFLHAFVVRTMSTCAVASSACTPASVRELPVMAWTPPSTPVNFAIASSTHPCTVLAFA